MNMKTITVIYWMIEMQALYGKLEERKIFAFTFMSKINNWTKRDICVSYCVSVVHFLSFLFTHQATYFE